MNKTSKLFMGFASLAMLAACSDDAPVMDGVNNGDAVFGDGQTAYMSVVLTSPRDFSRSTDFGEITGGNENGTLVPGKEHDINSAKFFFFDENGNFVLNAKLMSPNFDEPSTGKPNIEWESTSNVLVLEDLKSNTFPRYMLTVLNFDDFEAESTLQATAEKLVSASKALMMAKNEDGSVSAYNFVMSTSSYVRPSAFGTSLTSNSTYAVNELSTSDFCTTPAEATATDKAVKVHVERLAAKVELDVKATDKKTYVDNSGKTHTIYKLEQTVAGEGNDNNSGDSNGAQTANTQLYLEVLGWSLNATAKDSHLSKQLDANWFANGPFDYWEDARYFRSYWAYSYPYTLGVDAENALDYVKYTDINADGLSPKVGSDYPRYCLENTNNPYNILDLTAVNPTSKRYSVYNSRVTHVVLNTRLCDAEGNDVSALNFRGTLFTKEALKNYSLNALKNAGKLNYYTYVGSETDADKIETKNYKQIEASAIDFKGVPETIGEAVFAYATPDVQLYKHVDATADKEEHFEAVDYTELETALNELCSGLDLEWYNTRNIYYIPVEHNALSTATNNDTEGYYGVVRNHWYKISIDSFSKVGHGVYDPDDDTIVIKPDKSDDTFYYLGARINVLSWRVINQNVEL